MKNIEDKLKSHQINTLDPAYILRQKAEKKLGMMKELKEINLGPEGTKQIIHDLRVIQIEREIQNEELRKAQIELEKSQARFKDLYDYAPVGYVTVNEEGLIQETNVTASNLLGFMRMAMVKQPLSDFILPEYLDMYDLMRTQLFVTGMPQRCELRMFRKNDPPFWAHLEATRSQDSEIAPLFQVVISDITERKQKELYQHLSGDVLERLNTARHFNDSTHPILTVVMQAMGCDAAGIRIKCGDGFPYVAQLGFPNEFVRGENTLFAGKTEGDGPSKLDSTAMMGCTCGLVLSGQTDPNSPLFTQGGSFWTNDSRHLSSLPSGEYPPCTHRSRCIDEGYASMAIIPIRSKNEIVGLLHIAGRRTGRFCPDAVQALEGIATHIGWAWGRSQDEEKLCRANADLEARVNERTAELSMANAALTVEIEERKLAEEALRESEARFRTIVQNAQAGYFRIDLEGRIEDVNPSCLKMYGYTSPDEVIGKHVTIALTDEDMAQVKSHIETLLNGQPVPFGEFSRHCRDGSVCYNSASATPVRISGKVVGFEGFLIDITERKRWESEKAKFEAQYRQIQKNESLGCMAGAIAHKFNNLLGAIMGNIEIAMDNYSRKLDINGRLNCAKKATGKAAEVSSLMLTYLGHKSGHQEIQDLSRLCRQNLCELKNAMSKEINFEPILPTPGPMIKANAYQIQQVLINLTINAYEALGDKGGTIHLTVKTVSPEDVSYKNRFPPDWQPGNTFYACMEVRDTGCGIPTENIEKLFDPFFTSKFTGRGMGLPVVLGILRAHNGAVTVESDIGRGSTFRVYLPVSIEETHDQPTKEDQILGADVCTLLLVEDEPVVRKVAKTMLIRMGFTVFEASDGVEAIEMYRQHKTEINCVVSDMSMPRMDGWQTLVALRKLEPGLPVILISGYDQAHIMEGDQTELPHAILSKPYQSTTLRDAIYKALKKRPAE